MRTALQNFTRRRRLEAWARAVIDGDWYAVGWIDRRLHKLESACPFMANEAARELWLSGFRDAGKAPQERPR